MVLETVSDNTADYEITDSQLVSSHDKHHKVTFMAMVALAEMMTPAMMMWTTLISGNSDNDDDNNFMWSRCGVVSLK